MSNWAQDMWDDALKQAETIRTRQKAMELLKPLAEEIADNVYTAAMQMLLLKKENQQLKERLAKYEKK